MPTLAGGCMKPPISGFMPPRKKTGCSTATGAAKFTPLPQSDTGSSTVPVAAAQHVMPYESLQHPLSVYDQLLGVS